MHSVFYMMATYGHVISSDARCRRMPGEEERRNTVAK